MADSIRKTDAQDAIKRGIKYRDSEDYDRALNEFTEAVRLDPDNPAGYYNRGHIYVHGIAKQMHDAEKLGPNGDSVEIRLSVLEKAIRDFDTAIRLDPQNPDTYVGRGTVHDIRGNYGKAVKDYKTALKLGLEPDTARGIRQLLMILGSKQEKYEHYAHAVHGGAALTHPQEYINIGLALHNKNRFEEAIRHYTRAIELDPKNFDAYFRRAEAYAQLKRYRNAINDYTEVVKIEPNYDEAYRGRGNACTHTGDIDLAFESFTEAIRINPNNANAYTGRANVYGYRKRYDDALKDCEEAVKIDPENPRTYEMRGRIHDSKKMYEEAISDYTEAIRLDPPFVEAYYLRGKACLEKGDYEAAIMDFTRAIKLAPTFAYAYFMRGVAYNQLNRQEEAIRNVEKAHKLEPGDEEILVTLHKFRLMSSSRPPR